MSQQTERDGREIEPETQPNTHIRVLVAAAYPAVRAGLSALLQSVPESSGGPVAVVDEIEGSDAELRPLLTRHHPDVLLLDPSGDESGAVSRTALALAESETGLLVLGERPDADLPRLAGAALPGWGYLLRAEADAAQIVAAVRAVAAGLVALDRGLRLPLVSPAPPPSLPGLIESEFPGEALTHREIEVLQQMAEGLPNKQIATRLGISLHTVKFHVAQILGKLNATSRTEAVTLGARRGYIVL